jgi:hypothetical protein
VASRTGQSHLKRVQRRAVLRGRAALRRAVRKAEFLADAVFGEVADGFTRAEARARREFEKGQRDKP